MKDSPQSIALKPATGLSGITRSGPPRPTAGLPGDGPCAGGSLVDRGLCACLLRILILISTPPLRGSLMH
ncbi:hypothetical protein E2K80_07050 [Rhodophyticola sp. CCM32]|uniref:hypothetical protein n=1 Tax=Rhodophyticola sp. CCM32 TaxID=2916397 RepID=UPI00107F69BE|nr:hypothetical protein [Rhodophyticola sp. CCM32]QBY00524.1 hypothetical protein E2K80_07050 [Rhodophyticola sp. CCM32]